MKRFQTPAGFAAAALAAAVLVAIVSLSSCSGGSKDERSNTLTIVFSNDLHGEIRSCGCAAKDYGGLGRRATFIESVRDTTGDVLLLDAGDMFSSELNYGEEKADLTLRSMSLMQYHGIVPGEMDLGFGVDFLVERSHALKLPMVAANLVDSRADTLLFAPTREVTLPSGLRVGIVGVLGDRISLPPQAASDAKITASAPAIARYVAELRPRNDIVVVLAHMARGLVQRMANQNKDIDLVVYGHEGRPMRKIARTGNAYLLQVSDRGRYVGLAFAILGHGRPIYYLSATTQPMTDYYADDEAIDKLFRSYDLSIAAKEKTNIPAGVFEARKGVVTPYVGAEACKACHEDIYDQWAGTKHSHAFEILTREKREYDRDCTPCHTTGFYKRGGFENLEVTPDLINVQCEACHGNGNAHANDPDVAFEGDAREACTQCHNADQSPEFDFSVYWPRIAHGPGGEGGAGGR